MNDKKITRPELLDQIKFLQLRNKQLATEVEELKERIKETKPHSGEMKDFLHIVIKENTGAYHKAIVSWNDETGEAVVEKIGIVADSEYRAEFEGKRMLAEYFIRKRREGI